MDITISLNPDAIQVPTIERIQLLYVLRRYRTMKKMIAYCGLDCERCDAYLATINDDQELREKTAKAWSELNHVPILPEHINCQSCRAEGIKTVF